MTLKKFILLIIFSLFGAVIFAQNYPIYVVTTLTPPYSLRLSDYSRPGSQALVATVMVRDMSISNLPVKLHVKLETAGVTIESPVSLPAPPIYLSGGQALPLFGDDLAPYLNPDNLTFKGYSREAYRRTGQLPEGLYHVTVEVLHYHTGRLISNSSRATAWIALGKPPLLKDPQEGATLGQVAGMPLLFSWSAAKVGAPQGHLQYTLELWEQRLAGISPHVVAATLPPLYRSAPQAGTTLPLYPAALLLEPGMRYAWRVTAADATGLIPFEQGGQSELRSFTYLAKCDSVRDFHATLAPSRSATLQWKAGAQHLFYNVEVENPESGWQSTSQSFTTQVHYADLTQGSTYRVRVQPVCSDPLQTTGDFTAWRTLKVPPPKPPDTAACPGCRCDNAGAIRSITNIELRHNLKPGDTLIDKRGTTRYIIKTAELQAPGVYRGVFLFWAEIWGLKIVCRYQNLSVNTDNVILAMKFESVYDPQYLLNVDKAAAYVDKLAAAVDELATSKTIRDTVTYHGPIASIYGRNDSLFIVTKNPDGTLSETLLQPDQKLNATLVQGSNGEEYVVTGSGQVMGVDEFQKTGGSARQLEDYNREKESSRTADHPSVQFVAAGGQKYGFDSYAEATKAALQSEYPELRPGYRPAYKSVASFATDKVTATGGTATTTYKDEMGLPAVKNGDTELTLRGGATGTQTALYAYHKTDSAEQIVGKLNLLSYDEQHKKLYLVSVNGAKLPSEKALQAELNKIYAPAITKWEVVSLGNEGVKVSFTNSQMTHGGSGLIDVYNADQKKVISTFGKQEKNALYLFFVENVKGKDGDIAGYMPLQYQCGFIYDNPNPSIIAHELGHGAFNLRHTFSNERFIAAQGKTPNLMDYAGGTELWKYQWGEIQDPQKMWFAFLEEESESEYATDGHYHTMYLIALFLDVKNKTYFAQKAEQPDSKNVTSSTLYDKGVPIVPSNQTQNHALTGRTHGLELALTSYALYNFGKNSEMASFLWHRFGDCFGHLQVNETEGVIFDSNHSLKNDYIDIVENALNKLNIEAQSRKQYAVEAMKISFSEYVFSQEDITHQLVLLVQESINQRAYPQDMSKTYNPILGHALQGSTPDIIGQRPELYKYYVRKLIEMLDLAGEIRNVNGKAEVLTVLDGIADFAAREENKNSRLDPVLRFEYLLELKRQKGDNTIPKYVTIPLSSNISIPNLFPDAYGEAKVIESHRGVLERYLKGKYPNANYVVSSEALGEGRGYSFIIKK